MTEPAANPEPVEATPGPQAVPPPAAAPPPPPAKGTEPPPAAEAKVEVPRFFTTAKSEPEEKGVDPASLPPELHKLYKAMQADYTRKTQALADGQRKLLDEREAWVNKISQSTTPTREEIAADPMAEVRRLREEGEVAKADELLIEISEARAAERLRPLEAQARLERAKAQFRDVVAEATSLPQVSHYKNQVQQLFDGENEDIRLFRKVIFENPEQNMRLIKPMLYLLAMEQHAIKLEESIPKIVEAEVEARLAKEVSLAGRSPTKLVPGSTTSKETSPNRTRDIRAAIQTALGTLSS